MQFLRSVDRSVSIRFPKSLPKNVAAETEKWQARQKADRFMAALAEVALEIIMKRTVEDEGWVIKASPITIAKQLLLSLKCRCAKFVAQPRIKWTHDDNKVQGWP
ncbi:hypothetical protein H3V53_42310, partial [Paraburkholderia bengalensis]